MTLAVPALSHASTAYYFVTGHTTANTTIDGAHDDQWVAPSLATSCFTSVICNSFPVSYLDPSFDWTVGGGVFSIKENAADANITLSLWEDAIGGTLASPTGTLRDSVTVLASSVPNSYTDTVFQFATPYDLVTGHHYILTLTANTGTGGNNQYFIQGDNQLTITDSTSGGGTVLGGDTPEPSTWMLAGAAFVAVSALRRKKLFVS